MKTPIKPMLTCYLYGRFSAEKQSKGDSRRRQFKLAMEWCKENGHKLSDETFFDEGISAYRGKNKDEGDLRRFISLVETKKISSGSVLIVEDFSRLSRLPITRAVELFLRIINDGIGIVFTMTFQKTLLTQKTIDDEPYLLNAIVSEAQRANSESKHRGKRISEARQSRKENAKNGEKFKIYTPPWCDWIDDTFEVNQQKQKIIGTVFKMYLEGKGPTAIASTLNKENVPAFSRGATFQTKDQCDEWYKQYIVRLLQDRRLIGESEVLEKENYFPKAVQPNLFNQVQARMAQRSKKAGQTGKGWVSLFSGIVTCGSCGSSVCKTRCINSEGYEYFYLVCEGARSGKQSCKYHSLRYELMEQTFLFLMKYRPWFADMMQEKENNNDMAEVLRGELAEAEKQITKIEKLISNTDYEDLPKNILARMKDFETKAENLKRQITIEEGKKVDQNSPHFDEKFFDTLPKKLNSNPDFRLKAREVIRSMVKIILHTKAKQLHYTVQRKGSEKIWTVIFQNTSRKYLAFQILKGHVARPSEKEIVFDNSALRAEDIIA